MLYFVHEAVPVSVPENWGGAGVVVYDDRDQVCAVCGDTPTAVIVAHALQGWADQGLTVAGAYHRIIELRGGFRE